MKILERNLADIGFSSRKVRQLSLGCIVSILSLPAIGQVYQWKDADGRVVVSDTPAPGAKTKQISKAGAPETPKQVKSPTDGVEKKNDAKKSPEKEKAEKEAEEKHQLALREYCDSANGRLKELESGMRIGGVSAKGERYIMDDDQRATEVAKVRRGMQDSKCP